MNKNLIILGIVVLLICVGLSGCTDTSFTKSENEGMWYEYEGNVIWNFLKISKTYLK